MTPINPPIRPPSNPRQQRQQSVQAASPPPARPKFGSPSTPLAARTLPPAAIVPTAFIPPAEIPAQPSPSAPQMGTNIFDIPAEDFNPEAEAAESITPPPPNDGEYLCQLTISERNPEIREITWDQKTPEGMVTRGAVALGLVATISDEISPSFGRRVFFDINSFSKKAIEAEGSTNDVALVLRALGENPTGRPKTDAYRLKELVLGGYNQLIIETQWQAQFPYDPQNPKKSRRPYKIGRENFPKDDAGIPQPLHETPSGEPLRTIAVPVRFKRLTP